MTQLFTPTANGSFSQARRLRHRLSGVFVQPLNEADKEQQHNSADDGGDRATDEPHLDGEGGQTEQESADEGADDADADVAEQAEAASVHQQPGQPAGDGADEQKADQQADDQAGEVQRQVLATRMSASRSRT